MSPQTSRTIKRDDPTAHSMTRSRARASTVQRHEMTVVSSSVVDVVASAGGWLFDRRMAGWQVNVLVSDRVGERALRILGSDVLDLSGDLEAITEDPDRAATLAVAADVYAVDERVRRFVSASDRSRAEVALWGDMGRLRRNGEKGANFSAVFYRLSAAARAFKAHALLAAGLPRDSVAATEALFRCGVTALAPVDVRS
jgi:hypothetical protein